MSVARNYDVNADFANDRPTVFRMASAFRSVWIWFSTTVLIIVWTPLLAIRRLLDRDPVRYATGRFFRDLGLAMVKVNPYWKVEVTGEYGVFPKYVNIIL